MSKQDIFSWVEPSETRRKRDRPDLVAYYRVLVPASVASYGLMLLFLSYLHRRQPDMDIPYVKSSLGYLSMVAAVAILPWACWESRRIRVRPDSLLVGSSRISYGRLAAVRVEEDSGRQVLVLERASRVLRYGIAPEVDVSALQEFLAQRAPSERAMPQASRRGIAPKKLAIGIGSLAGAGLLGLLSIVESVQKVLGSEAVRILRSLGGLSAVLGGTIGLWVLFRTRHPLVILACLAAVLSLALYGVYVLDPMLKP